MSIVFLFGIAASFKADVAVRCISKQIAANGSGGLLWTCSIFPLFGQKRVRATVLPSSRCGNGHELTPDNLVPASAVPAGAVGNAGRSAQRPGVADVGRSRQPLTNVLAFLTLKNIKSNFLAGEISKRSRSDLTEPLIQMKRAVESNPGDTVLNTGRYREAALAPCNSFSGWAHQFIATDIHSFARRPRQMGPRLEDVTVAVGHFLRR
jgi:hypothetical protein